MANNCSVARLYRLCKIIFNFSQLWYPAIGISIIRVYMYMYDTMVSTCYPPFSCLYFLEALWFGHPQFFILFYVWKSLARAPCLYLTSISSICSTWICWLRYYTAESKCHRSLPCKPLCVSNCNFSRGYSIFKYSINGRISF